MDASFRCRSSGSITAAASAYEDNKQFQLGCVGSILHFLHLHHHHSKLVAAPKKQRKHRESNKPGTKYSKLRRQPSAQEEYESVTTSTTEDQSMEDFDPRANNTAAMRSKENKDKKKKKKNKSPAPKQLSRTFSIHYLECDDYVIKEDTATGENTNNCEMQQRQEEEPQKHHPFSRESSAVDQTGMASFSELQDPTSTSRHHMEDLQMHGADPVLSRSGSYPTIGNAGRTRLMRTASMVTPPPFGHNERASGFRSKSSLTNTEAIKSSKMDMSSHDHVDGLSAQSWSASGNLQETTEDKDDFKTIRNRIKNIFKGERKEGHRISLDGVLHKVPYGQKPPSDSDSEGPAMDKYGLRKIVWHDSAVSTGNGPRIAPQFRRSRSLSDSLERYSYLLESINRETKEDVNERLKPSHGDMALLAMNRSKTLGRIYSLPESEPNFLRKDDTAAVVHDIPASRRETDSESQDNKTALDSPAYEEQISSSLQQNHETDCSVEKETSQQDIEDIDCSSEVQVQPAQDGANEDDDDCNESVRNSIEDEDVDHALADIPDVDETCSVSSTDIHLQKKSGLGVHRMKVASKDEAEFNYIWNILKKSGVSDKDFLAKWHSPEQPINPSLYLDEMLNPEVDISDSDADTDLYHLLLFDLINEVLMEISMESSSYDSSMPCISSHIRSTPLEHNILPKLWQRISWHLSCQQKQNAKLDPVGWNRWMNLNYDMEKIGLELDNMILDDLVDEMIFGDLLEEAILKSR